METETTNKELQSRRDLVQSLNIVGIHLKSCNLETFVLPYAVTPVNSQVNVDLSARWEIYRENHIFVCFLGAHATGISTGSEPAFPKGQKLYEIKTVFAAVYTFSEVEASEMDLTWFAENNAPFNAYPYIRETLESLSRRIGVPGIVLPFFRGGLRIETKKQLENENRT